MKKKIILFSDGFVPENEFIEFSKKLGYEDYKSLECRLDEKIIEFIETRLEKYGDYLFYKGIKNLKKMCGFEGVCYIQEVDLSKKWIISSDYLGNTYRSRKITITGSYEDIYYFDINNLGFNSVEIKYIQS